MKHLIHRFPLFIVCAVGLLFMALFTACAGVAVPTTGSPGSSTTTITGSVASVNAANGSVTLTVNGTSYTITGLTPAEVSQLQSQVGKMYTITAGCNGNSCTITNGTNPVASAPGAPESVSTEAPSGGETAGTPEAGSIQFIGKVQSVSTGSIVVSMPNGSTLSMSIVSGQTDLGDNNALPAAGTTIKVDANANTDGSYTATSLKSTNENDPNKLNTVEYQGVTTSAVGSDNVLHFTVGQKPYSFTIGTGADLGDFNNNAQSIQANQMVKVEVLFNGSSNGSVTHVSLNNGQ